MSDEDNTNGHNDTELTAEERRGLEAWAREVAPPAELEDRIVQTLTNRGLLAHRPRWWIPVVALAASIAIFVTGFAFGTRAGPDGQAAGSPGAPPGRQYVVFLYEGAEFESAPLDDPDQIVREYGRWAADIHDRGRLAGGERLADDGWVLAGSEAGIQIDRRLLETPAGVVSGYFLIDAPDDQAALAIAESHPHLRRGGHIELRALDPIL